MRTIRTAETQRPTTRQMTPSQIIDDIAFRYGVTRVEAENLPLRTALRVIRPNVEIIDADFEVLTG